jgi:RES domain-containing protein
MSDVGTEGLEKFIEYFNRDLEKWFTADIACCDQCYEDLVQLWPHLQRGFDTAFAVAQVPLEAFYAGGHLRDIYTKEQFDDYVAQLSCPRCSRAMGSSVWVYNFPFSIPPNFELTIAEVSELARRTPFLLLQNSFCVSVLSAILDLATTSTPCLLSHSFFRARSPASGSLDAKLATFDTPPAECVVEGRYNHAGSPVLYLASNKATCHAELRHASCLAIEFRLLVRVKILDLTDPFGSHESHADLLNCLVYSALLSATQDETGMYRPHYVLSRFVADCARASGFDAIKYPSTRQTGFNLVLIGGAQKLEGNVEVAGYHELSAK